jgi:hypothetical protein
MLVGYQIYPPLIPRSCATFLMTSFRRLLSPMDSRIITFLKRDPAFPWKHIRDTMIRKATFILLEAQRATSLQMLP